MLRLRRLPKRFLPTAGLLVVLLQFVFPGRIVADGRILTSEFLLDNWDVNEGLPSSRVNGLTRAADGYLWLATPMGLFRFDGWRFVMFNSQNNPGIQDNRFCCLASVPDGTFWAGTEGGKLTRGDQLGLTAVDLGGATHGKRINSMAVDSGGTLWLATQGAGLIRLAAGRAHVFNRTNGLPSMDIAQVLVDSQNRLWLVTAGKLFSFEQGRCYPAPEGLPALRVWTIAKARDGGLWAGLAAYPRKNSGTVIFKLKDRRWTPESKSYPWLQTSPRSRANALLEDPAGRLWCATAGDGVFFRSHGASWQQLALHLQQSQADALFLELSKPDTVWIGTLTAGLYQARPLSVTSHFLPAWASQHIFITVCATRDGSIWGGTDGAGVFRWRGTQLSHYSLAEGLTNLTVAALLEDSQTNLWAGTFGGLFRLHDDRFEPVSGPAALRRPVLSLFEDRRHRLWVGVRGGLVCLGKGQPLVFGSDDGLPSNNNICGLAEDGEGRLWVAAGSAGLFHQTDGRFEPYRTESGTNVYTFERWQDGGEAHALLGDPDGSIWLATKNNGLYHLQSGRLSQWRWAEDGLPSNDLFALLQDRQENLWLSSAYGIFGLSKKSLASYRRGQGTSLNPWHLTQAGGLPFKVCSGLGQPAASKSLDGRLWFADGSALASFKPEDITAAGSHFRRPVVEELVVDGRTLAPDNSGEVRVKSGAHEFEFHYTLPDVFPPDQVRFQVKLSGLDNDWEDAKSRRIAYYNRLPAGNYEFQVRASGPDGVSRKARNPLHLRVIPRFYERTSVRLAGALMLIVIVAGTAWQIARIRSHRQLEQLHFQEAMNLERQRIARDIHDDLGSGLTEIILLGDSLREEAARTASLDKIGLEISAHARALTRAMDEVVWAINPRNDTLENFLNYLSEFAQEYLALAGLRCRWDLPPEIPDLPLSTETRHHLYLSCKEVLNNIVKHAGASEVWLRLALRPNGFTLIIEDNGKGFVPAGATACGNGLINLRRRMAELDGTYEIDSRPGNGTRVRFSIQASSHFRRSRTGSR